MAQTCPISVNRIDAHLVRVVASEVVVVALLLLITHSLMLSLLLLFDFSVRAFRLRKLSPFVFLAGVIIEIFHIDAQPCDEGPKRFALYLGIGMVVSFTFLYAFGFSSFASILVGILLLCAFLEAAFDYCIGCKIYYFIQIVAKEHRQ